jgi:hypothetical protein
VIYGHHSGQSWKQRFPLILEWAVTDYELRPIFLHRRKNVGKGCWQALPGLLVPLLFSLFSFMGQFCAPEIHFEREPG